MRKVIMWNIVTLDGYFEGATPWELDSHAIVWGEELERLSLEQLDGASALLFGRATYEGMAAHWRTATGAIAEGMNAIEKVVFSNTLADVDWSNSRLVRGEAADEVARLRQEPGGDMYIFGSAILCDSLTRRGLIDEYRICIAPLLLGDGRPLFPRGTNRALKLLDARTTATGGVILRYVPT